MKPNVIVTGGAGYIGSHVCSALAGAGFTPVTIDNFSTGHPDFVRWGPSIEGDIRNIDVLDYAFGKTNPTAVIHLAALSNVSESMRWPSEYNSVNVGGTRNILDAMKAWGVKHLVFSSSAAVYGNASKNSLTEADSKQPVSVYGQTKLDCEELIQQYHGRINGVSLRYFNAAGADKSQMIGEDHSPETHLIPSILNVALKKKEQFTIFGSDHGTPDGSAVRDYIHVQDLADAHVRSLLYLINGLNTSSFNVGTGAGLSVFDILYTCREVCNIEIPASVSSRRAGDPPSLIADASLAAKVLRWVPQRTSIQRIVADAWAFHVARFGFDLSRSGTISLTDSSSVPYPRVHPDLRT